MSRRVDHDERRGEIAAALVRVAGRRGLHAVRMRDTAEEAGVSVRLVQYYFDTKEKLLHHGLQYLADEFGRRVAARLAEAGEDPGPREKIDALLMVSLPADEESRTFHLVWTSYAVLAVTDEALAAQPFLSRPDAAEDLVAGLLEEAAGQGLTEPGLDARTEAVALLALSAGLGTAVLSGQRDPGSAAAVLRHQLGRLFRDGERTG
ncbi:TetR/AcrR family transcriptional regulator [Streptomyces sp. HNM0574]|uniref:TetR/AcrR family transcriptional regulator n=1 Tax=Streptomyces sp. HNM0574 TaxID=2714954 RepID=UPI00146CBD31|nr:TetR/AcrR family transcriptional regulator [Streptomyces sp. HNM0574]NLU70409.1 TetR/AcrR family transcriptional regulator [Streptomyces sp. HNM0574]